VLKEAFGFYVSPRSLFMRNDRGSNLRVFDKLSADRAVAKIFFSKAIFIEDIFCVRPQIENFEKICMMSSRDV